MKTALIGYTGFVGSNLKKQYDFTELYNSENINKIVGKEFDLVVCAGVNANKFWANNNAELDKKNILALVNNISKIKTKKFVLISTVDIYSQPINVDEESSSDILNHPYGQNRLFFELWVKSNFDNHNIIRLPGLFGNGLKKNIIYDLLNDNCLYLINKKSIFQYYNLDNLWKDIVKVIEKNIPVINFATEPVPSEEIITNFFKDKQVGFAEARLTCYDFKTKYYKYWNCSNGYLYSKDDILKDLANFIKDYKK